MSDGTRAASPTSLSIEALEEIVRNCQRNEQRLHELERHTRHERKKAERLLRQANRTVRERQTSETSKDFVVSLDDRDNENLLKRVEKLLAGGDGTTTSSEIMSSQERHKKSVLDRTDSPIVNQQISSRSIPVAPLTRQLPSACSIEYELSSVDRLLSERTPIHHREKSDPFSSREQSFNDNDKSRDQHLDERDEKFYERLNNYVHTGRFTTGVHQSTTEHHSPKLSRSTDKDDELKDLSRRCEDLLVRLHAQRQQAEILENSVHTREHYRHLSPTPSPRSFHSNDQRRQHDSIIDELPTAPTISLQKSLELLRPDFISRSRQRARRIRLLREEREHNAIIEREREGMLLFSTKKDQLRAVSAPATRRTVSYFLPTERPVSTRVPVSYRQMKQATKKKYQQLPEVNDRRRQAQMEEIRRRNILRAKLFRARLRNYVARYGRTNIDESLTMVDP